jgi:hypothetical protein
MTRSDECRQPGFTATSWRVDHEGVVCLPAKAQHAQSAFLCEIGFDIQHHHHLLNPLFQEERFPI